MPRKEEVMRMAWFIAGFLIGCLCAVLILAAYSIGGGRWEDIQQKDDGELKKGGDDYGESE